MNGWTCPKCQRLFGRARQSHECAPAMTIDDYFATGPALERAVFDKVFDHLRPLGPLVPEFVSVGVFFKNPQKFSELRPMQRWIAVSFWLPHRARHATITKKVLEYHGRFWHTSNVTDIEQMDEALLDLLEQAYHSV